jgi:hypothetical protein
MLRHVDLATFEEQQRRAADVMARIRLITEHSRAALASSRQRREETGLIARHHCAEHQEPFREKP